MQHCLLSKHQLNRYYIMIYAKIKEALMELKDEVTVGIVINNTYGICYNLEKN